MKYALSALVLAAGVLGAAPAYAHDDDCPYHHGSSSYACRPYTTTESVWVQRCGWHYEETDCCCEPELVYGPYYVRECRTVTRWECRPIRRSCDEYRSCNDYRSYEYRRSRCRW